MEKMGTTTYLSGRWRPTEPIVAELTRASPRGRRAREPSNLNAGSHWAQVALVDLRRLVVSESGGRIRGMKAEG
jgi:hypothetical protein